MEEQLLRFRKKKKAYKRSVKRREEVYQGALDYLAKLVMTSPADDYDDALPSHLQRRPWENTYLERSLIKAGYYYEKSLEQGFIAGEQADEVLLAHLFITFYYSTCIASYMAILRPKRFPNAGSLGCELSRHFVMSLALIAGQQDKLDALYNMLKVIYEAEAVIRSNSHISDLVLALVAASKGQQLNSLVKDFAYQDMLDNWDTPDIEQVSTYLTRLCDDQIIQVSAKYNDDFFEFGNGNWGFIPYAALTWLKLRQNAGLPNPDFTHELFTAQIWQWFHLNTCLPAPQQPIIVETIDYITQLGFSVDDVLALCK